MIWFTDSPIGDRCPTKTHRFIYLEECAVCCFQRQLSTVVSFRVSGTNAQPRNRASCENQKLKQTKLGQIKNGEQICTTSKSPEIWSCLQRLQLRFYLGTGLLFLYCLWIWFTFTSFNLLNFEIQLIWYQIYCNASIIRD